MDFIPPDDRWTRRIARELRFELGLRDIALDREACLDAVARAYGHADYAALRGRARRAPRSAPDDGAPDAVVSARRALQAETFAGLGLDAHGVAEVLDALRPTARQHPRGPGARSLVTLLDVTQDRCEPIGEKRMELMSALLQREGAMDVRRGPPGAGPDGFELFLRTVPENVRAVARHFREGRHEVTFGVTVLLGELSRSHEEAALWVATLREMWRRLGGGRIRIGHFAEAFSAGVPCQEAVAETWARRRAGERSPGIPRYPHPVPEGGVGFMLSCAGRPPRVAVVPDFSGSGFMERHARMFEGAPGDPTRDLDANLGTCAELIRETGTLTEGDPQVARNLGILLWLALVHPGGEGRALEAVTAGARRHVTMTFSRDYRVRTSVADAFEDRTRMLFG